MDSTPQSFFDFFGRPEQVVRRLYTDELAAPIEGNKTIRRYQNLFCDAFGHHIEVNFDAVPEIQIQPDDPRRFITKDSLTAYFLDTLYQPPAIYETPNGSYSVRDSIPYPEFCRSISAPAATCADDRSDAIGTNRFSFIIGDVGTGKTLLVSKVLRDIIKQQRDAQNSSSEIQTDFTLPVYFDFESHMKSGSGELLPIDDTFFDKLSGVLLATVQHSSLFRAKQSALSEVETKSHGTAEAKFIDLVRTAHRVGLHPLLVLDNIDGYDYFYSKYTFFEQYRERQVSSIRDNINRLTTTLRNGGSLGHLGMSVVIVARHYVYAQCLHTLRAVTPYQNPGSVFQLASVGETEVVAARMQLFTTALKHTESDPRLRVHGEDYKRALERIWILLGLQEKARSLREADEESKEPQKVLGLIRSLCHHGNRGMVAFLSSLKLDYRDSSSLMERFLWNKPFTLALLYIAKLRSRYSQAQDHFPNLFLVDGLIQKHSAFPEAHKAHLHTYWLKYLLLAYINAQAEHTATHRELRRLFVLLGRFDETIFNLALGSLATSTEFGCLEPEPGEPEVTQGRVHITARGTTLVSDWQRRSARFCFSFTYLQLIVDDFLMSYPLSVLDKIYIARIHLKYLFEDDETYAKENARYLEKKMHSVLALLRVLEISYKLEQRLRPALFSQLSARAPSILLNFDDIVTSLFDQFRRISGSFTHADELMAELQQYWRELCASPDLERQLTEYFASGSPIEV
jgi:hypothetical protein